MKLLLIDDDDAVLALAELALTTLGRHVVLAARNARDAIRLAVAEKPDAILLDVVMPDSDGPVVLGWLREAGVESPVVFWTARVSPEEVARYLELGAAGVIAKPFNPMQLSLELERALS